MPELDIASIISQIIGYLVLLYVLNRYLFKPIFDVMDERKQRTEGSLEDAVEMDRKIVEGMDAYNSRVKEATAGAQEQRSGVKTKAVEVSRGIIDKANEDAGAELDSMKAEIRADKDAAMAELKAGVKTIAKAIAEKVLDRKVASIVLAMGFSMGLVMLPEAAFASSGGEGAGAVFFWKVMNFILLMALVCYVWVKYVASMLDKRSEEINNAIEEAGKSRDEALARFRDYEQKVSLIDKKIEEIRETLTHEAALEKIKIIKEAEAAAVRIKEAAKYTAEQELKNAKLELRAEAAALAIELAEEFVKKNLTPKDQERLVKEYVTSLKLN